jgi:flagellar protein FliS
MMQENLMMYEKYKKTSAATMSPGRLLIMLYDRAIKAVEDAIDNIDDQQAAEAHKHIIKAQDIVLELRNTLNMDYSISAQLQELYDYFYFQLVQANIHKDKLLLKEILPLLAELRETWQEAVRLAGPTSARREQNLYVNIMG